MEPLGDIVKQVGGPLWVAMPDGTIVYSFGQGLDAWEDLESESIGGTHITDYPDPAPLLYAIHEFRAGRLSPILVDGTGTYERQEHLAPVLGPDGNFIAVIAYDAPEEHRVPRSVIDAWWAAQKQEG